MIAFLSGTIKYFGSNYLILLTKDGVGYKVHIKKATSYPPATLERSDGGRGKLQATSEFFIFHHIREDRSDLYGFKTPEELQAFELLLTVSGVGPKMALNILSNTTITKLQEAIAKSDSTLFTAISGVGKKMAAKILLELKNKITDADLANLGGNNESEDALDALKSLGYKKSELYPYLAKIPPELTSTEQKVKWLLKNLKK